jgi:hypothetical protein
MYAIMGVMWYGFDPELSRQLAHIREMVSRQRQSPTREWPLIVEEARAELLVVREWPDGSLTAYTRPIPETSL